MTPDYIEQLAKAADPQQLWRLSPFEQQKLPEPLRRQLDTGVALRRHAEHVLRLRSLVGTGRSLLLTPLGGNGTDVRVVQSPTTRSPLTAHGINTRMLPSR